jgi:hypothetical protein
MKNAWLDVHAYNVIIRNSEKKHRWESNSHMYDKQTQDVSVWQF